VRRRTALVAGGLAADRFHDLQHVNEVQRIDQRIIGSRLNAKAALEGSFYRETCWYPLEKAQVWSLRTVLVAVKTVLPLVFRTYPLRGKPTPGLRRMSTNIDFKLH
jgi:hypothetical protein